MEPDDYQYNVVAPLAERAWPEAQSVEYLLCRMVEELGELAQAIRKLDGPRMGHDEAAATVAHVEDELGDCKFLLYRIANATGASMARASERVVSKIERRLKDATDRAAEGGSSGIGPLAEVDG